MTIAIGIRFCGGMLLGADTEVTYGDISKTNELKITYLENDKTYLAMAYSGSVPFAKMFIERCSRRFFNLVDKSKHSIREWILEELNSFHCSHIYPHPARGYSGGPDFCLIVGIYSAFDGLDCFSTNESAANDIEYFHCIGIGEYLARYIIQQEFRPLLPREEAELLAESAIKAAKGNIPGCGGAHQIIVLGEGQGQIIVKQFSKGVRDAKRD